MTKELACFTYKKQVGKGAFSRVYKVKDSNNKCYALKEVGMSDFDNVKSVVKENSFTNLEHPNILKYEYVDICERPKKLEQFVLADGSESRPSSVCNIVADQIKMEMGRCGTEYNINGVNEYYSVVSNDGVLVQQYNTKNLHDRQDVTPNNEKIYTFVDTSYSETSKKHLKCLVKNNSTKKVKKYCYFITEYCSFSLREFIDCRNEFYYSNVNGYKDLVCGRDMSTDGKYDKSFDIENLSIHNGNITTKCEYIKNKNHDANSYQVLVENKVKVQKSNSFEIRDELGIQRKIPKCYIKASFNTDLSVNYKYMFAIVKQILLGLIFLHSKSIIHNDIKPSNILLTSSMKPKIGDFGMMTIDKKEDLGIIGKKHKFKTRNIANHKNKHNDLKQFGLLLFELIYPVKTAMERYQVLPNLEKRGALPDVFVKENPDLSKIIRLCLNYSPANPVFATDILQKLCNLEACQ